MSTAGFLSHQCLPEDSSKSRIELKKRIRKQQYEFVPKSDVVLKKNSHENIFGTSENVESPYKPGKRIFPSAKTEQVVQKVPSDDRRNYFKFF